MLERQRERVAAAGQQLAFDDAQLGAVRGQLRSRNYGSLLGV